jgi:predicted PurR-regulated permease PerM
MNQKSFSPGRMAEIFIVIVLGFIILREGQFVFGPLAFSVLFAVMLLPVCVFFERFIKFKIPSILLTLLSVTILLAGIIVLFSVQLSSILNNITDITGRIGQGLEQILFWLNENLNLNKTDLQANIPGLVDNSVNYLQKGISSSTTFIFNMILTMLLVFFLLWYRSNFKRFLLNQARKSNRKQLSIIINQIRTTLQKYLYGLLLVILILAILNSIGLLIIGIDYALFWGIVAAFLSVIPYIGTTLGGTLPFLYSVATADNWWQPVSVVALYVIIQTLEGNIITPNVIGSSVSINAMVAILAILVGGVIWGISGIILAIPAVAVVKIILEHNNSTKPLAFLFSNKVHKSDDAFWEEMDDDKYRL